MNETIMPDGGVMITDGHLGGYVKNGDEATKYPDLWDWLVRDFGIRSVIDVGCGDGVAVNHFIKALTPYTADGIPAKVLGIDGLFEAGDRIRRHDYATGPFVRMYSPPFDLCWSCEFVEHVEERYVPNFLATFACAKHVLMTHAEPGQAGYHHVNCQLPEYWRGAMAAIGYDYDMQLTRITRELAAKNTSPWNHYKRSGLAFTRN